MACWSVQACRCSGLQVGRLLLNHTPHTLYFQLQHIYVAPFYSCNDICCPSTIPPAAQALHRTRQASVAACWLPCTMPPKHLRDATKNRISMFKSSYICQVCILIYRECGQHVSVCYMLRSRAPRHTCTAAKRAMHGPHGERLELYHLHLRRIRLAGAFHAVPRRTISSDAGIAVSLGLACVRL